MARPETTRFAPSPTGFLHLGHAYSAVLGHDRARQSGGRFLLRIEDLDGTRCRPAFVDAMAADLGWLGLTIDGQPVRQSERRALYRAALDRLKAAGLLYPCFCTRADIAAAAGAPHDAGAAGAAIPYPGTCRRRPRAACWARAATEEHAIRLDVGLASARTGPLSFRDAAGVAHPADPEAMGDPVLARKDIGAGYLLASVVDDAAAGVTLVVRGRDLLAVTPQQRLLQQLLGYPAPRYLHHRLLLAADGRRLAKRDQAETLAALRARGVAGGALAKALAALPPEGPDVRFSFG